LKFFAGGGRFVSPAEKGEEKQGFSRKRGVGKKLGEGGKGGDHSSKKKGGPTDLIKTWPGTEKKKDIEKKKPA